uniref:Transcription factor bHLH47 n=1 Tax=Anthurium amnicola TaxID=1678845 RepID=A0A1D1YGZ4_9ARAE
MVSELTLSVGSEGSVVADKQVGRSPRGKKNQGRVPKKIHKAEREKLKRDHLNEVFHELGHALDPARHNNGKASILDDATRLLRDLLAQVESLRRENATLVTESRYVTVEKNELRDENLALEAEIQNLQKELRERVQSKPAWGNGADTLPAAVPQPTTTALTMQQLPVVGPVYVIPLNQELPDYPAEAVPVASPPKPSSHVKKPHARYPTPSDSWPLQILSQQTRMDTQQDEHGGSNYSTSTTRRGEDLANEREVEMMVVASPMLRL